MKKVVLSSVLLTFAAAVAIYGCLMLQSGYHGGMGPAFLLFWPSILLSIHGFSSSWIVPTVALTTTCFLLGWLVRRRWFVALPIGLAIGLTYCLSGLIAFRHLSIPAPAVTPYDNDGAKREEYKAAYVEGFHNGINGVFRTYCFSPEHTTQGFYEGMMEGLRIQNRVLRKSDLCQGTKNVARAWAGHDGVSLDPDKKNIEQGAAPASAGALSVDR